MPGTPALAGLSRRSFLSGVVAVGGAALGGPALLAACSKSSSSSSEASGGSSFAVQLVWLKNVQFGGSWIAQKQGYYSKHGVKPDLLAGGPNTVVEPIVVSGKALVGISNPDSVASAVAKGADLQIVATTYLKSPFMVMSLADTPIKTPREMLGKKIGVPSASTQLWQSFLKAKGPRVNYSRVVGCGCADHAGGARRVLLSGGAVVGRASEASCAGSGS